MFSIERYYCIGCGMSKSKALMYIISEENGICKSCAEEIYTTKDMTFEGKEYIDIVISPFLYDGIIADIVRAFKFGGQKMYGDFLTALSFKYFNDTYLLENHDLIVPVPLHENRLKERGYNQSDIIAKRLGKILNTDVDYDALIRTRDTLHQSSLKGKDRINNVKDAFLAQNGDIEGKKIILADDIYTMGETANECAKALINAGAEKVTVFTLCKTVMKRRSLFF